MGLLLCRQVDKKGGDCGVGEGILGCSYAVTVTLPSIESWGMVAELGSDSLV